MSTARDARLLSLADVENAIVDEIECGVDDYQSFDWGPIMTAFERLSKIAEERASSTATVGET